MWYDKKLLPVWFFCSILCESDNYCVYENHVAPEARWPNKKQVIPGIKIRFVTHLSKLGHRHLSSFLLLERRETFLCGVCVVSALVVFCRFSVPGSRHFVVSCDPSACLGGLTSFVPLNYWNPRFLMVQNTTCRSTHSIYPLLECCTSYYTTCTNNRIDSVRLVLL